MRTTPSSIEAERAVRDEPERLFRVQTARLPLQFAFLEQAKMDATGARGCFIEGEGGSLSVRPEIQSLLGVFVERCKKAGIPALWERGTSPDEYYASTRRFLDESTAGHVARSRRVALAAPASPKYLGGNESALTDGIKGWNDYHMHWLGFEGEDMEATIDLGALRTVSSIGADFLQDIESWIFMPRAVEFSISEDGRRYRPVGAVSNTVPEQKYGAIIEPFSVRFEPVKARFVRVRGINMKTCPTWHKGAGGKAWIFADEITVLIEIEGPLGRARVFRAVLLGAAMLVLGSRAAVAQLYKQADAPVEARVRDLVSRMTLEEKFWQLFMLSTPLEGTIEKCSSGAFGFQIELIGRHDRLGLVRERHPAPFRREDAPRHSDHSVRRSRARPRSQRRRRLSPGDRARGDRSTRLSCTGSREPSLSIADGTGSARSSPPS